MLEKVLQIGLLYDFYGPLLTDKQQQCLALHYIQDMSLGEIAAELGVSRQAVHDILKRSEQQLHGYEQKLGLTREYLLRQEQLNGILCELRRLANELPDLPAGQAGSRMYDLCQAVERLLDSEKEET